MKEALLTRKTLLQKIRNREDKTSWDEFIEIYRRYIYVVARNMNLNHQDAEDVMQKTLLILWEKMPMFQYDEHLGTFRSWLCTVIRNMVINLVKKHSRLLIGLNSCDFEKSKAYLESVTIPEVQKLAEDEWHKFIVNKAWDELKESLNEKSRQAYLLFKKGLSPDEIAEQLGIATNTAYVYRIRVEEKLVDLIKSYHEKFK
jgi:RNA polymerase sigma factor (sigma-70 family)